MAMQERNNQPPRAIPFQADVMKPHGFKGKTDGIIHIEKGRRQTTLVERSGDELRLKLLGPSSTEWQSRIDLRDPLRLLSPYMRALMLFCLWCKVPSRIHIIGLGGGRIPAFLRNHFPDLEIDCTEIDDDVYQIAQRYFGFRTDPATRVIIADGREYLARRTRAPLYDAILVDAFSGVGFSPLRLATAEFVGICKAQLREGGTFALNVLPRDRLAWAKAATVSAAFKSTYLYDSEDAFVVFANDLDASMPSALASQDYLPAFQERFHFSLGDMAGRLRPLMNQGGGIPNVPVLTDADGELVGPIAEELLRDLGRNDPCPCGSGRKFKKCHGIS
jgi:hypothetical protein